MAEDVWHAKVEPGYTHRLLCQPDLQKFVSQPGYDALCFCLHASHSGQTLEQRRLQQE